MISQTGWRYSILFLLLFCATSLIEAKENTLPVEDQNNTSENLNTELSDCKRIIGNVEKVRLVPPNVVLKARIDTGAKTTSIDAREITPFERDGKQWVRFVVMAGKKEHTIERKVIKTVQIKRHGAESQDRYVVKMRIILGDVSQLISVTLNDRDAYQYPVLIGRNFLRDYCIVDVGKKFQFKPMVLPK
ncbi:MAG: RimK/LysX family protein [Sulfurovum sp.]|nr:RimK/LysX family protein [Sulfurovum sp.]